MAISYVGAGAVNAGVATPFNVAKPAGVATGDLLIIVAAQGVGSLAVTTAGFTEYQQSQYDWLAGTNTFHRIQVFWRIADGTEGANFSVTGVGGNPTAVFAVCVAYRGTDQVTPITSLMAVRDSSISNTKILMGQPALYPNSWQVGLGFQTGGGSNVWTSPAGTTERLDTSGLLVWDRSQAAAGAFAHGTLSNSGAATALVQLVLQEAGHSAAELTTAAVKGSYYQSASMAANTAKAFWKPANMAQGDLLLAFAKVNKSTDVITPPAGWTNLTGAITGGGTQIMGQVFYKFVGAGESASDNWQINSADELTIHTYLITKVSSNPPSVFSTAGNAGTGSATVTAPSITTTVTNSLLFHFFGTTGSRTSTPPTGFTEVFYGGQQIGSAYGASTWDGLNTKLQAATGATGAVTETLSGSEAWVTALISIEPGLNAPTNVTPANGSAQNTSQPTLGMTLPSGGLMKGSWEMAQNTGFTTGLRTVTEPDADLKNGNQATTEPTPLASALTQGTWYLRGRVWYNDVSAWGPYSSTNTFTVSHPPTTANHSPTGSIYLPYGTGNVLLDWDFSDSYSGDSQTAYQVIVERNSDGTLIVDTGKVVSATSQVTVAIPAAYKDQILRWKVRVWDMDDVVGAYSSYQLFGVSDAPSVTVTAPAEGSTINTPVPTVQWTTTKPQTQRRVRVIRNSDGVTVHNSGYASTAVANYTIPSGILVNNTAYTFAVDIIDNFNLSATDSNIATTSWVAPAAPDFTVDITGFENLGYNRISWVNTPRDDQLISWRVYHKLFDEEVWTLLGEWFPNDTANLLTANQASIETDASGWSSGGNCTLARSTAQAVAGSASLAMTSVAAGNMTVVTASHAAVTAGVQYTVLASLRAATVARSCSVILRWWDSSNSLIATSQSQIIADSTSRWTPYSLTVVAPVNAATVRVDILVEATAAGEVHYVDAVSLVPGTPAPGGLWLPGTTGHRARTPDDASLSIAGDIDIRVQLAMDDWTPTATQGLIAQWTVPRTWLLEVLSTGVLRFGWSTTGADTLTADSTVGTGFANGSVSWVRFTLDVDNGAGGRTAMFYTSVDGGVWTPLGSPVTAAGITNIFNGAGDLSIGSSSSDGSVENLAGIIHRAQILNGINGPVVFDVDFTNESQGWAFGDSNGATGLDATGKTVTINGVDSKIVSRWAPGTTEVIMSESFSFDDYMAPSQKDSQYAVVQVATRFETEVESE